METISVAAASGAPPTWVGRYRISGELGRGGMGAVYRAIDESSGRVLALKRLESAHQTTCALFEREYHTLTSLKHPSVIEAYDFGIDDQGRRYYTMELLEGDDLASVAPLDWRIVCRHLRDIAASLSLVHARRLVHRDVSPRNIRLCANGRAKLLDFGALSSFGVASEIVGTPMCTAPEVLRMEELDQRTDLFSLGVVTYYSLTGRKPYSVTALHEIAQISELPTPRPPSEYRPEIPAALDELVLSLLSPDREGRPHYASEVAERLSAIAQLEDDAVAGCSEEHLLSTELCGRQREKRQLAQHLTRARRGEGVVVVLEASAGMGRSRLAADTLVDARLAGFTTLRVGILAHPEPRGPLLALARGLLEVVPLEAREALGAQLPILGSAFPELKGDVQSHVESRDKDHSDGSDFADTAEHRARIQDAFVRWVLAIAARRPMLIVVDDVHACDPTSAGALVALAHSLREVSLLLVVTQELNSPAPIAVRQLSRVAARIKLRALSMSELEALVTSALGEVPDRARLTRWLYGACQGNPAQSLDLLSNLIERGLVRYSGGTWSLPADLREQDLPATLEVALAQRVASLGHLARDLARVLAIHQGDLGLAHCSRLLPNIGRAELFAALDDLLARQVVSVTGNRYRLRQPALRPLLLEGLDPSRLRELHAELASALLATHRLADGASLQAQLANVGADVLGAALQAGWHFLRAGQEARGRELLRAAGIELTHRGEGLAEAVPALEAAIQAYEGLGRSRFEIAYLMVPLTLAGAYNDFRLDYRYGEPLLDVLCELTGLTMAQRWAPVLGHRLAFVVALPIAFVRFRTTSRRLGARSFREAFLGLLSIASAIVGSSVPLVDAERADRVTQKLSALELFPRSHPARFIYDFLIALTDSASGRFGSALARAQTVRERLRTPGGVKGMPETARVQLEVGLHMLLGSLAANRTDESIKETIGALEQIHTSVSRQTLAGLRAHYHAGRGERELFERWQREVDVLAAQNGSTWRQDFLLARTSWWFDVLAGNPIGLKRAMRRLEVLAIDAPTVAATRDAAIACYLSERGRHREALERYRGVLEAAVAKPTAINMRLVATYARILRGAGDPHEACSVCERALGRLPKADEGFTVLTFGTHLEHVLSLAELGRLDNAIERMDALIEQQRSHDNPLLHALAHRTRASLALRTSDAEAVHEHLSAMHEHCRRSRNPVLIAQARSLEREVDRAGLLGPAAKQTLLQRRDDVADRSASALQSAFAYCRGPRERMQFALDAIIERSHAESGYLYLLHAGELRFAAPLAGAEPPEGLRDELARKLAECCRSEEETHQYETKPHLMQTLISTDEQPELALLCAEQAYRSVLLTMWRNEETIGVGAIALVPGAEPLLPIPRAFLEEIARGLFDAGDVLTARIRQGAEPPAQN